MFQSKMSYFSIKFKWRFVALCSPFSYGKYLLKNGKFKEAVECLKICRDVFIDVRGRYEADYVNIVNDLAVAHLHVSVTVLRYNNFNNCYELYNCHYALSTLLLILDTGE